MRYARLSEDHVVVEIIELPEGIAPADAFHADIAAALVECGEDVDPGWVQSEEGFAAPQPAAPTSAELIAYVARKRWLVETGGITVDGVLIKTSRDSQNMIANACQFLADDPEAATIDFEVQPGIFQTIDRAAMVAIGIAVGRHVQACFSVAKTVVAEILAGTITTLVEIDAAEWPASEALNGA